MRIEGIDMGITPPLRVVDSVVDLVGSLAVSEMVVGNAMAVKMRERGVGQEGNQRAGGDVACSLPPEPSLGDPTSAIGLQYS